MKTIQNHNMTFHLQNFLNILKSGGIPVQPGDYKRIALALQSNGTWTRRRLRSTLMVLLAKNEQQASLIQRHFDHHFSFSASTDERAENDLNIAAFIKDLQELENAKDKPVPAKPKPEAKERAKAEKPGQKPKLFLSPKLIACLLILFALSSALLWYHWPDDKAAMKTELAEVSRAELTPSEKSGSQLKTEKVKTRTYNKVPYVKNIEYKEPPNPKNTWQKTIWLPGLALLSLLAYLVYLYNKQKIPFPKPLKSDYETGDKVFRFSLAKLGGKPAPLLDRDTLDEAADAISYFQSTRPANVLNVPSSIRASLDKGGLPDLHFYQQKQIRTLLILRDKASQAKWNSTAEELAAGIKKRGVPVLFGEFKGSPEHFRLADGRLEHLEDLEDNKDAFIILIFSDGRRIKHSQVHAHIWTDLKSWPQCAWLDYQEPRLRPVKHPAKRYELPLFTADAKGILAALKRFLSEQGGHVSEKADKIPLISADLTLASLAARLGDALPWAQDCSLLQPCSPGLADALCRKFHTHLPASRVQRFFSDIPGTQNSSEGFIFSSQARKLLKQGFSNRNPDQQKQVLKFLQEELNKVQPEEKDSPESLDWQSRQALLKLELGEPAPEIRKLSQIPAMQAALNKRLQESHVQESTAEKIDPETLQTLAHMPDSPIKQYSRDWYPLGTKQKIITALLTIIFVSLSGLTLWQASQPENASTPNWTVEGTNALALLQELSQSETNESVKEFRGNVFSLPEKVRLKADTEYRLTLYGEKYWQTKIFSVSDGKQAHLILAERFLKSGDTCTEPITGMELVWVPKGCFQMGSNSNEADSDEKPVHEVCVDGFLIGKFEVTQGQYKKIMNENPSDFKSGDDYPVENVSWNHAKQFISKLNEKSDKKFSLPTEAQWEYAARSGGKDEKYAGANDVDKVAWYYKNSGDKTHAVGTKAPNDLGIYDMSGNVWEWCEDVYDGNAYSKHERNNPVITTGSSSRVVRGGSWINSLRNLRTADRGRFSAVDRYDFLGFRLCLSPVRQSGQQ